MRIAEVSCFSKYSVGKIMQGIKAYINNNTNSTCEIFYARFRNDDSNICVGNKVAVYSNALIARLFDNDGFLPSFITKKLIDKLEEFNPDIIHIHCLHGYYANVKILFKYFKYKNIKIVWTMHDAWAITGHCCYFSQINCERWKNGCFSCPLKKTYPSSLIFDCSSKNYSKKKEIFNSLDVNNMIIVTPSKWLEDIIKQSYLKQYSVTTIYNGIDISKFKIKDLKKPHDKKLILGVASVRDERKGLDKFLELSEVISPDWEILLIGKFPKKIILPSNITHIDRTDSQDELVEIYNKSAILFNPTLDDNYPTVNLEAQACGLKVLTYNTGGSLETNCGNLFSCKEQSPERIFKLIKEICSKENKKVNLDKLNFGRMSKEYFELFKKMEVFNESTYEKNIEKNNCAN